MTVQCTVDVHRYPHIHMNFLTIELASACCVRFLCVFNKEQLYVFSVGCDVFSCE